MDRHVITQAEVEYALDRVEFERLMARRGADTLLMWWYQITQLPDSGVMTRGTASDVRG